MISPDTLEIPERKCLAPIGARNCKVKSILNSSSMEIPAVDECLLLILPCFLTPLRPSLHSLPLQQLRSLILKCAAVDSKVREFEKPSGTTADGNAFNVAGRWGKGRK